MSKRKQPKPPGRCVFCGREGRLSKEHIWADWLGEALLPRTEVNHHQLRERIYIDQWSNIDHAYSELRIHQGDAGSRKLRTVCQRCNNTWMSGLQIRAKPILTSLISGRLRPFVKDEVATLGMWLSVMTVVVEQMERDTASIGCRDRRLLLDIQHPLPGWAILVGRYAGEHWKKWVRHVGMLLKDSSTPNTQDRGGVPFNAQITVIGAGAMVACLISSEVPSFVEVSVRLANPKLVHIHPMEADTLDLAGAGVLSDAEVDAIQPSMTAPMYGAAITKAAIQSGGERVLIQHNHMP